MGFQRITRAPVFWACLQWAKGGAVPQGRMLAWARVVVAKVVSNWTLGLFGR